MLATAKLFSPHHRKWALLLLLSIIFSVLLNILRLPAALMLGPMLAGIIMGCRKSGLAVKPPFFKGAQTIVGCMIAASISPRVLEVFLHDWWLFIIIVLLAIFASSFLGYLLARFKIIPLSTAILGFTPGAASTMVILAAEFGDDLRMVAFMQYLRVLMTAFTAAIIAALIMPESTTPAASMSVDALLQYYFPSLEPFAFGSTLLLALVSGLIAHVFRIPAGFILVTLFLGGFLHGAGWIELQIPNWLLAITYTIIGWRIGLSFDIEGLKRAYKILPHLLGCTITLMLFCAFLAWVLVLVYDIDPLTAFLATSPGGLDTIAAIIYSRPYADMSFVMTLQVARLLIINMVCPFIAKLRVKH